MDSNNKRSKISKKRRNNAILYPIYKMFSWDLLCFYSVEFLFYTVTKGITVSQVLILTSIYMVSKIIFQIPSVAISDYLGRKKAIILGNLFVIIYLTLLIVSNNMNLIIIANIFCAFGYNLKTITEGNLLYDSVSTKGGDGIYTKIDSNGATWYYIIDTALSFIAGYLFVINNYIPMFITLICLIISFVLSFKFKDIYSKSDSKDQVKFKKFLGTYSDNIKKSFKFIKKSKRIRAYIIFAAIFYSIIKIVPAYRGNLLTDMQVSEEQFAMIYAVLSLISAISVSYTRRIQRYLKNKTLKFISLSYILSVVLIGIISIHFSNSLALPVVFILLMIIRIFESQWYVTEYTYLKNFTNQESRSKITFTFEMITGCVAGIMSLFGAVLLDFTNIRYAILIIGLLFLALIIIALDYMKKRFGLKPNQYKKEDIKFES